MENMSKNNRVKRLSSVPSDDYKSFKTTKINKTDVYTLCL